MHDSPPPPEPESVPISQAILRLLAVVTAVLVLLLLQAGKPVFLPLVTGLMIAALVWPVLQRLQRSVPRWLALLAVVLLVVAVLLAFLGALGWSAASVAEELMRRRDRLAAIEEQLRSLAARVGLSLPRGGGSGAGGGGAEGGLGRRLVTAVYSGLAHLALAVGFAILALAEYRDVRDKVRLRFSEKRADKLFRVSSEVSADVRRYFIVKTATSGIAGVATFSLSLALGIDFAAVWGLLAFLLEYVPAIGSLIAVVPPTLFAAVQFDGLEKPAMVLAAFTVMQLVLGNYVDPRIEGKLLALSPFVVLLSIVFFGWLWGPPGSLLGVPLVVAFTAIARHFQGTHWIWSLLAGTERDDRPGGGRRR